MGRREEGKKGRRGEGRHTHTHAHTRHLVTLLQEDLGHGELHVVPQERGWGEGKKEERKEGREGGRGEKREREEREREREREKNRERGKKQRIDFLLAFASFSFSSTGVVNMEYTTKNVLRI